MLTKIQRLLNWELKLETVEYTIPKWNVYGRKPSNDDILYVLLQTYEENGHVYLNNEYGVKIAGTHLGTHFRFIMYWLLNHKEIGQAGGALLRETDLVSTCGDRFCLRGSHTKMEKPPVVEAVDYDRKHLNVPIFKRKVPKPKKASTKEMMFTKEEANDRRLKCISRKIWLTEEEVPQALRELKGHHGYPCKLSCNGWHTSSKGEVSKVELRRRNKSMPY